MGYQIYKVGKRFGGYGVPAYCEHPGCNKEIDRGMSYACGGEPFSDLGCDRYFCEDHKHYHEFNTGNGYREGAEVCEQCAKRKEPFPYKPEYPTWIKHLLTDKSWKQWRQKNKEEVKKLKNENRTSTTI
jgi:hypothetical protein